MRIEEYFGWGCKPEIKVGEKCTIHYYRDSHPAEVVEVSKSGKTCWIRRNVVTADKTKEGGIGHQNWLFKEGGFMKIRVDGSEEPQLAEEPDNYTYYKVTKRKNGNWRTTGSDLYVAMGQWHNYYDWSF